MKTEEINAEIQRLNDEIENKLVEMEGADEARAAELDAEIKAGFEKIDGLKVRAEHFARVAEERSRINVADPRRPTEDRAAKKPDNEVEVRTVNYIRSGGNAEFEVRAPQSVGTATAGGHTVDSTLAKTMIESLKYSGPMFNPDVTNHIVTEKGEPLKFVTDDDTANNGAAVAENGDPSDSELAVGAKTLNAYSYHSGVIKVSYELLNDSSFDIGAWIGDRLGKRMGRTYNALLTTGDGVGDATGLLTAIGSPSLETGTANAINYEDLIALEHSVDFAYRQGGTCGFMMHDTQVMRLRLIEDSTGRPIWQDANLANGTPARLLGYPVYVNNNMVNTVANGVVPIIFGDFKQYYVRRVQDITIQRFNELYARQRQVGFAAWVRFDGALMDAGAVKGLKVKSA